MPRDSQTGLYQEEYFNEFLAFEKKRCERSEGPAFLMLADLSAFVDVSERQKIAKSMTEVLSDATRDTDVKGWHVDGLVIGIMFTVMTGKEASLLAVQRYVANKCLRSLESHLGMATFSRIQVSLQTLHGEHIRERAGRLEVYLAVGTYEDYATDGTNLTALSGVSAKITDDASKGSIKGVGGYGYTDYMDTATDYSDMSVKINAKIIAIDKLPFTGADCAK